MRHSIGIALTEEGMAWGWEAFTVVERTLRHNGLTVDQIEWRWYDEIRTLGLHRAVFEATR